MTHRRTGMKSTLGLGIPCVEFLLGLQECCGFSLRMMPAWNDVSVEYLVRASWWSLVVTNTGLSASGKSVTSAFWEAPGNVSVSNLAECHENCWSHAFSPPSFLQDLLFSLGIGCKQTGQGSLCWFSPTKGGIQSWRSQSWEEHAWYWWECRGKSLRDGGKAGEISCTIKVGDPVGTKKALGGETLIR